MAIDSQQGVASRFYKTIFKLFPHFSQIVHPWVFSPLFQYVSIVFLPTSVFHCDEMRFQVFLLLFCL